MNKYHINDILSKQHAYTLHSISYRWNSLEIIGNKLFTNAESSMAAATTASASSSLTTSTTSTFFLGPNPCTLLVIENSSNVDARSRRFDGNMVSDKIFSVLMELKQPCRASVKCIFHLITFAIRPLATCVRYELILVHVFLKVKIKDTNLQCPINECFGASHPASYIVSTACTYAANKPS